MTMCWIAAVMFFLLSVPSRAETLTLRSGSAVNGKLQGMDAQEVRIERCGRVERYAREEVKSISLESDEGGAACEASPQLNIEFPAGMKIPLQTVDYINSEHEPAGQVFRAKLETAIEVDGRILVSRGSLFIIRMVQSAGMTSQPCLTLDLVGVQLGKEWARIEPLPVKGRSLISAPTTIAVVSSPPTALPDLLASSPVLRGERILVRPNTSLTFVLEQPVRLQPEGR
jgi:hypothetical protein